MSHKLMIDLCAMLIIVTCAVLIGLGIDTEVKAIFAMAGSWVFYRGVAIATKNKGP